MYLFDKTFRVELKNTLATEVHTWIKYFINDKYDDKLIAFFVRACHLHTPVYCMISMACLPFFFAVWIYTCTIIVFLLFIYLRGCFLSLTEHKISKEDITIADPFIMLCNGEITPENRIKYSLAIIIPYLIIATGILFYRFYF